MAGGCEGVAAAMSAVSEGTEGAICWADGGAYVGVTRDGEASSAGRLHAKIARATIKTTDPGLRGSMYFIPHKDFHNIEMGFPVCFAHYIRAFYQSVQMSVAKKSSLTNSRLWVTKFGH